MSQPAQQPRNPFAAEAADAKARGERGEDLSTMDEVIVRASFLWLLLGDCGRPAEVTLARRRLEECVFWAGQAGKD